MKLVLQKGASPAGLWKLISPRALNGLSTSCVTLISREAPGFCSCEPEKQEKEEEEEEGEEKGRGGWEEEDEEGGSIAQGVIDRKALHGGECITDLLLIC